MVRPLDASVIKVRASPYFNNTPMSIHLTLLLNDNRFQMDGALTVFFFEQKFVNFQLARRVHKNYNRKKGVKNGHFAITSLDHYLNFFLMEIWASHLSLRAYPW